MSSLGNLDSAQSREVEEQLFSTHRLQATRHMPVPLPRQDFWSMVKKLLNTLDMEIQSMLMKGITGMRLQNLQKRQSTNDLGCHSTSGRRAVTRRVEASGERI